MKETLKNTSDIWRLHRKAPDYTLYSDEYNVPIGIIEAKKPRYSRLTDGLEQADGYAKNLGHITKFVCYLLRGGREQY
ncbi:MAG: hypothetical protein R1F54_02365 [Candidatus Zeuxoniibacter abyssi]|nr:MAG: hypothetical protein R1F54_02365 [Candidatus Persebacteraceae bacterium AB1(2)]